MTYRIVQILSILTGAASGGFLFSYAATDAIPWWLVGLVIVWALLLMTHGTMTAFRTSKPKAQVGNYNVHVGANADQFQRDIERTVARQSNPRLRSL